ncbi:hypothetical protein AB2M62_04960 [Sphingomonas sp. MMS12-HWE2-04]|uniref:hypothetical protein n=1 Tax=Sphingomonas sp. MMS12-HWE2-04 TaxID=3234199 RepID=UPI00384ED926
MPVPEPLRRSQSWLVTELRDHPVRFVFAVGAIFTLALVNVKLFAGAGPWWRGWADQKAYLASARGFAALDLDPALHWYPLIYPLLGAPFAWLAAPFVPANIACFGLAFLGFRRVCARFDVSGGAAALLFLAATLLDPRIGKLWVEPWTTTLSAALMWLGFGALADLLFGERISVGRAALLGIVLMLIPLVRPADVLVSAVISLFALVPLLRQHRLLPVMGAGAAMLAGNALLYLAVYGARLSDYIVLSRDYGFTFADLGWKAVVLLVAPEPWFPGAKGMLGGMPWLLLGAAGLALALLRLAGQQARLMLALLLAALVYTIVMLAYVDLLPSGLWRFNNVHYFKWLFPLFALGVLLLVRLGAKRRGLALVVLAALVLPTCLRFDAVETVGPARALRFTSPAVEWAPVYTARSAISDDSGSQRNYFDYHQMLSADGSVIAVALKRPFAGSVLWYGAAPTQVAHWPVGSPATDVALPGRWPRAPAKRLEARLVFGMPCWLPGACQTLAE